MKKKLRTVHVVTRSSPDIAEHFVEIRGIFFSIESARDWKQELWDEGERPGAKIQTFFVGDDMQARVKAIIFCDTKVDMKPMTAEQILRAHGISKKRETKVLARYAAAKKKAAAKSSSCVTKPTNMKLRGDRAGVLG